MSDISASAEKSKVCVVNEVDDEGAPSNFTYTTKLEYGNHVSSASNMQGCKCTSSCLPGDNSYSCVHRNARDLPYISSIILLSRKLMLDECNDSRACLVNCQNRLVQRGSFSILKRSRRKIGVGALAIRIPFEQAHLFVSMPVKLLTKMA